MQSKFLAICYYVLLLLCTVILSGCQSLGDLFGYQTNFNIINQKYFDNRYYNGHNRHIPYGNIEELNNIENRNVQIKDNSNTKLIQAINPVQLTQDSTPQKNISQPLIIDNSIANQKSNNIFKDDQQLMYDNGQNSLKTLDNMIINTNQNFVPPIPQETGVIEDIHVNNVDDLMIEDKKPQHKKPPIHLHKASKAITIHKAPNNTPNSSKQENFEDVPLE